MLVSAFIAVGPPSRIIEEALRDHVSLVLPEPVFVELERILTDKLGFELSAWRQVESFLRDLATEWIAPPESAEAVTVDPDDDVILACAVAANVEVLVSGDRRHLLPLGVHRGIRIMTPQALLAELRRA